MIHYVSSVPAAHSVFEAIESQGASQFENNFRTPQNNMAKQIDAQLNLNGDTHACVI